MKSNSRTTTMTASDLTTPMKMKTINSFDNAIVIMDEYELFQTAHELGPSCAPNFCQSECSQNESNLLLYYCIKILFFQFIIYDVVTINA